MIAKVKQVMSNKDAKYDYEFQKFKVQSSNQSVNVTQFANASNHIKLIASLSDLDVAALFTREMHTNYC